MKLAIEGNSEEIKKVFQAISGSKEHELKKIEDELETKVSKTELSNYENCK